MTTTTAAPPDILAPEDVEALDAHAAGLSATLHVLMLTGLENSARAEALAAERAAVQARLQANRVAAAAAAAERRQREREAAEIQETRSAELAELEARGAAWLQDRTLAPIEVGELLTAAAEAGIEREALVAGARKLGLKMYERHRRGGDALVGPRVWMWGGGLMQNGTDAATRLGML